MGTAYSLSFRPFPAALTCGDVPTASALEALESRTYTAMGLCPTVPRICGRGMDSLQVSVPQEAGGSTCDAPLTLSRGSESSAMNRLTALG